VRKLVVFLVLAVVGPIHGFTLIVKNYDQTLGYRVRLGQGSTATQEAITVAPGEWVTSPHNWMWFTGNIYVAVYDATGTTALFSGSAITPTGGVRETVTVTIISDTSISQTVSYTSTTSWGPIAEYFVYGFTFMALLELGGMAVRMFRALGSRHPSGDI